MIINNLGTVIYTIFFGKKVGEDAIGNSYFISKKNPLKKWILYKKKVDPTNIPINGQIWLTNDTAYLKDIVSEKKNYNWQNEREVNMTGTKMSYHPAKKLNNLDLPSKQKNHKFWKPK
tara:strand:+ start:411 stop:764 length:354 start_codon:yes stop_codon:yes gene_type:complete